MSDAYYYFFFSIYAYICLTVFVVGTVIRYDRAQYNWGASSSLLLSDKGLRVGNVLFHIGVLFIFLGHFVGLLTPHFIYEYFITAENKQMLAIIAGGIAGVICFAGLTILLVRRLCVARIRMNSAWSDIMILVVLWIQLSLGLTTIPFSLAHTDASVMLRLSEWAQRTLTFRSGAVEQIVGLEWPYQLHLILGLTIFLLFPFTRLVHMLSLPILYLWRPHQVVRSRTAKK